MHVSHKLTLGVCIIFLQNNDTTAFFRYLKKTPKLKLLSSSSISCYLLWLNLIRYRWLQIIRNFWSFGFSKIVVRQTLMIRSTYKISLWITSSTSSTSKFDFKSAVGQLFFHRDRLSKALIISFMSIFGSPPRVARTQLDQLSLKT